MNKQRHGKARHISGLHFYSADDKCFFKVQLIVFPKSSRNTQKNLVAFSKVPQLLSQTFEWIVVMQKLSFKV